MIIRSYQARARFDGVWRECFNLVFRSRSIVCGGGGGGETDPDLNLATGRCRLGGRRGVYSSEARVATGCSRFW